MDPHAALLARLIMAHAHKLASRPAVAAYHDMTLKLACCPAGASNYYGTLKICA